MNDVANRGAASTAVATLQQLRGGLQTVKDALPATMGDPFLRLGTDGIWIYGQDNVEVQDGSLWAINPFSIMHGYACWTRHKDRDPKDRTKDTLVGEVMRPMTQAKPPRETLANTGWDWADQVSFQLQCLTGEDEGEQVLYKTTSVGGITAVKELIAEIMKQLDVDANRPVPKVELQSDSYMHKNYGKTYVPMFVVKGWVEMTADRPAAEDPAPAGNGAAEQVQQQATQPAAPATATEPAPARQVRQRRAPAAQAEPQQTQAAQPQAQADPAAAAPVRRRRVSA